MIRTNIYKRGLYRFLIGRRLSVPSNTQVSPPFHLFSNVSSFSKEEISNKMNIANTVQEAFMDALIWNHCKNVIQVVQPPTYAEEEQTNAITSPKLTYRFQMLISCINCVIELAKETRDSVVFQSKQSNKWLQYYQFLFCEVNQSITYNWKGEMQRLYKLDPNAMELLRSQFNQVLLKLEQLETIPVTINNEEIVRLNAKIIAAFADIVLESEAFRNYRMVIGKCAFLIEQIKVIRKQNNGQIFDYFLIESLAKAMIVQREILDAVDATLEHEKELQKHQFEEFENMLQSYIAEEPYIPLYYTVHKLLLFKSPLGDKQRAEGIKRDCDILINELQQTRDLDAYIDRIIALSELGQYDKAEADCQTSLSIYSVLPDVHFYLIAFDMIHGKYMNGFLFISEAVNALKHLFHNKVEFDTKLEELKTACLSTCRNGISDPILYEIVLAIIECRFLLSHMPNVPNNEQFRELFESLIAICHTKILSFYPNNMELLCILRMLNVTYEVQIMGKTANIFHKLTDIISLLPNHPGVLHFVGVMYFSAFNEIKDKDELSFDAAMYLEQSMESFTRSLKISQFKPMPQFRYAPYRTMCSLASVTAYMGLENDQYRIRLCTDALAQLKEHNNNLIAPRLLIYRSAFAERGGLAIEAIKDLDRALEMNPFNMEALIRRRDLLRRLRVRLNTAREDELLITNLINESESMFYESESNSK
jgi:tetratricopeptide (TPR) repeat protein